MSVKSAAQTSHESLLPCPFCGGPVALESAGTIRDELYGPREFWGVVCRNTTNRGGTCCMEQRPSASKEAAIDRWNMRNGVLETPVLLGRIEAFRFVLSKPKEEDL